MADSDAKPTEESADLIWRLGAQTPAIPPDETMGMTALRRLSNEEHAQYKKDAALLRDLSSFALFRPVSDTTEQVLDLGQRLAQGGPRFLSQRELAQVAKALGQAREVMGELPSRLKDKGATEHEEVKGELERCIKSAAFVRLQQSASLPLVQLVMAVGAEVHEVVVPPGPAARWPVGTAQDGRVGIGVLSLVEQAQIEVNRVAARWLLSQSGTVREASLRTMRLAAEIIEGAPCLIGTASEKELIEAKGQFTFDGMPMGELRGLQEAMLRAERLLESVEREPATKGARGMTAEQIAAALADQLPPAPVDEAAPDTPLKREDKVDIDPSPPAALLAVDPAGLLANAEQASFALEHAWSVALEEPARRKLVADWQSLLASFEAQLAPGTARKLDLGEIARLEPKPQGQQHTEAHDAAIRQSVAEIRRALEEMQEPSLRMDHPSHGQLNFFSSGAFAMMRARTRRLAEMTGLGSVRGVAGPHLRRAELAMAQADAEAVVLHCMRALAAGGADLTSLGEDALALVGSSGETLRALTDGRPVDDAVLLLLAQALLPVTRTALDP